MKRILIVHSTLHIGGAEEVTANLCAQIDRSRFSVTVCHLRENGVVGDKIKQNGTHVVGLPSGTSGKTDYITWLKLRSIIKKLNIDIVHSQDVHALADCSICKLTMPRLKFVHTFHYGNYPKRDRSRQRLERLFWRVPDRLVAVSNRQKAGIQSLYGIPDERVVTLWNGVDVESGHSLPFDIVGHYRAQGRVLIGCINTLIEQKGMFDLIRVAKIMKGRIPGKFAFIVAGGGHLMEALRHEIELNNLTDDVVMLGWVDQAAKVFLPHADIFFQPSLWEAMSIVLLEAMAMGKAIVATSVGETPLVLDNGQGRVVGVGNIEDMAVALEELVLRPALREDLGARAKARYEEAFSASMMARRYESLYEDILSPR